MNREEFRLFKVATRVSYYVSNKGTIKSVNNKTGAEMFRCMHIAKSNHTGEPTYFMITFEENKKTTNQFVHRIVCEAFNGPCPPGKEVVNHIDGNKLNNTPENLEWVTRSENALHARRTGLIKKADIYGEKNPNYRMTEGMVLRAIELSKTMPRRLVAKELGVGLTTVNTRIWSYQRQGK